MTARSHTFTIEFPGVRFDVTGTGDHVRCARAADVPDETLRHLLLDHVLPRVLSLRGALVFHASALVEPTSGAAVAFLGASGAGKSTLAASLVGAGWSLLSDDALVIEDGPEGPRARPTYPWLRLWPEHAVRLAGDAAAAGPVAHYTDKVRLPASSLGGARAFVPRSVPLARVYLLDGDACAVGAPPSIGPVTPGEALRAAFEAQLRLSGVDRPSLQGAFDRIATSRVLPRLRQLSFAREVAALPAVRAAVLEDLRASAQEATGGHSAA